MNVRQRASAAKIVHLSQVAKVTVCECRTFSLATAVFGSMAYVQSCCICENRSYVWAKYYGCPLTKAEMATTTVFPTCSQPRPTLISQCGIIPWETRQPPTGRLITLDLSIMDQCVTNEIDA